MNTFRVCDNSIRRLFSMARPLLWIELSSILHAIQGNVKFAIYLPGKALVFKNANVSWTSTCGGPTSSCGSINLSHSYHKYLSSYLLLKTIRWNEHVTLRARVFFFLDTDYIQEILVPFNKFIYNMSCCSRALEVRDGLSALTVSEYAAFF